MKGETGKHTVEQHLNLLELEWSLSQEPEDMFLSGGKELVGYIIKGLLML